MQPKTKIQNTILVLFLLLTSILLFQCENGDNETVVATLTFEFSETGSTSGNGPSFDLALTCSARATLTCAPGCNASLERIVITKDGEPIGSIPTMTCGPGASQVSLDIELTECGSNDLSGGFLITCSDTETRGGNFDYDIPANLEPWGVEILANGSSRIIGN